MGVGWNNNGEVYIALKSSVSTWAASFFYSQYLAISYTGFYFHFKGFPIHFHSAQSTAISIFERYFHFCPVVLSFWFYVASMSIETSSEKRFKKAGELGFTSEGFLS